MGRGDDDDFVDPVPIVIRSPHRESHVTPMSSRITRSQSQNIKSVKGKEKVIGGDDKRICGKRTRKLQLDNDINCGPGIRIKKNVGLKAKVVKPDMDVEAHGAPNNWKIWDFYTPRERHAHRSVSVHCNNKICSEIKQRLTGGLYERFKASCFGHLLEMPAFHVQNQLLVALLFREVVRPTHDALYFEINGKRLRFGLKEFALVTGLRCVGDVLKKYGSSEKNRIVQKYFGDVDRVSKTDLEDCFKLMKWDNDDDAIKITALYFINTFLFSTKNDENHPHLIDADHFDIVESGEWESYPWGTKVFLATIESIHDKVRVPKSMYRFAGMPYALLVWFFECCPTVNGKLASRIGHKIPRILNWEVTQKLLFQELQKGFFSLAGNEMVVDSISPSELELSTLNLPQDEEPDVEDIPVPLENEIPDNDTEEQQDVADDDFVKKAYFMKELDKIKQNQVDIKNDIQAVSNDVAVLNQFMGATADRIFKELSQIAKKVAANVVQEAAMEGNFSFGGFGSDNEVGDGEQMRTNDELNLMAASDKEGAVSAEGPTRETTIFETDINNGDIDISNIDMHCEGSSSKKGLPSPLDDTVEVIIKKSTTLLHDTCNIQSGELGVAKDLVNEVEGSQLDHISTEDLVIIDELCEKVISESAKRKAAAAVAAHSKSPRTVAKDVRLRGFPDFRLFSTQEEQELFGDKHAGSAEGNCQGSVHENLNVVTASHNDKLFTSQEEQDMRVDGGIALGGIGLDGGKTAGNIEQQLQNQSGSIIVVSNAAPTTGPVGNISTEEADNTMIFTSQELRQIFTEADEENVDPTIEVTPPIQRTVRSRRPARYNRSPFINTYGDSGSSLHQNKKAYFSTKHPFTTNIWRRVDNKLSKNFTTWIKRGLRKTRVEPYNKTVNVLRPKFDFGVCVVNNKDWFHTLHHAETPFQETHLDVIMYYLRKKSKYDPRVRARFTTTDCLFDSIVRDVWRSYLGNNRSLTVAADNHIISDYMKGLSMRCNTPWRLVDDVLFPIKVVEDWHWVLGRLSFKDMVLYVYDQKLDNFWYDKEVIEVMEAYSILLPLFLCAIGFYGTRTELRQEAYGFGEVPISDKFKIIHIYDMDGVPKNDYGVFAAAFAEHYIHGKGMPGRGCNINKYRRRYGALLWDYGVSKQAAGLESDPEDM